MITVFICWKFWLSLCLVLVPVATDAFGPNPIDGRLLSYRNCRIRRFSIAKPLFLSLSKNSNEIGVQHKNICMLVERGSEQADRFREEATRIADQLGIPLLSTLENSNDGDKESESDEPLRITHALKLVPYEYTSGDDDEEEAPMSTFALAIEPIERINDLPQKRNKKKRKKPNKPFFVDLCPPANSKAGRRASGASGKADLLVKAVAPRKGRNGKTAVVWDLTAGLGQDSLVLARSGAQRVTMVERNPVVAALLQDALRRLELDGNPLMETFHFFAGHDALEVLQTQSPSDCDVVYLDPMFPPRQKQSAVKKGMSILHGLLETHIAVSDHPSNRQTEEQELLEAALGVAKLRVVVKRPAKAPLLGDGSTKPSHALTGSVNRWDVYVKPPSE